MIEGHFGLCDNCTDEEPPVVEPEGKFRWKMRCPYESPKSGNSPKHLKPLKLQMLYHLCSSPLPSKIANVYNYFENLSNDLIRFLNFEILAVKGIRSKQ